MPDPHIRPFRTFPPSSSLSQVVIVACVLLAAATFAQTPPNLPLEDRSLEITPETRDAIRRGLDYLAAQQNADGSFHGPRGQNTGIVSFIVLSHLATGTVPERGPRGCVAARGIDYVLGQAQLGGLVSNPRDTDHGPMYEHAMSTLMLAEVWGMYNKPGLLDALQRAVNLIISCQNDQGGWRYQPRPADADVSVTVMQLVALRAAKNAGLSVPRRTFDNAIDYVKSCAAPNGGFMYQPGVGGDGYARTAAGACSLLACGDYESPEVLRAIQYLQERKEPDQRGDQHLHYGLYYAAQVMYQAPDPGQWPQWFPVARADLLGRQDADGHWEGEAGPLYGTSMAILALSVPYRYLPIYQH